MARDAGYTIDWSRVKSDENDEASRLASEEYDTSGLVEMFGRIVDTLKR